MRSFAAISVCSLLLISSQVSAQSSRQPTEIDFNRDIRPLLFGKCITCHGPDEAERAAGLRLDNREGAFGDLGGYAAIEAGDADASEIILRVTSDDPDSVMPPPGKGEPLTEAEVDLLRRWIDSGGDYATHWSYQPPVRPELPQPELPLPEFPQPDLPQPETTRPADWATNAIDHFTLVKMRERGLSPNPPADRLTLARRVAIDLTGLPPTWRQAKSFADDPGDHAYERYVDSLLASPAFGERWARVWLDLARYADSAGYADDPPRTIWAYRDYVINAINSNMPFDQFTIEQIAGDLLPNPTDDQLIATAFHRNTLTNNEGGTNNEEFRNVAVVDRVNTTMAVWMGTTMACAQCHTHKYDPITHEDYFSLFAFFNSTEDADLRDERPLFEIWSNEQQQRKLELQTRLNELKSQLKTASPEIAIQRDAWIARLGSRPVWKSIKPLRLQSKREPTIDDDGWIHFADDPKPAKDRYTIELATEGSVSAIRLETSKRQTSNFVITDVTATWTPEADGDAIAIQFSSAHADFEQDGFPARSILADKPDPRAGWAVSPQTGRRHVLTLPITTATPDRPGRLEIVISQQSVHARHLLDHFRIATTYNKHVEAWSAMTGSIASLIEKPSDRWDQAESQRVNQFFLEQSPEQKQIRSSIEELEKQIAAIKPTTTVPVMRELTGDRRRETKIQIRGNYQSTGKSVSEGTPDVFHPLENTESPNRLDLARWLVADENPLTPRVIANRHWEQLFGIGIVETSEEFGSQGELPSHPALLDWLAVELRESGWDLKHLVKTIVMSSTYRQSSETDPQAVAADPSNRLLARGPRFRVSAEMVRDQALFVSGLLSEKRFGPPVKPPQPELGLKAAFGSATDWKTSKGEDRYRRGLYTTWRRSSPYPSMAQFDAPNRDVCTVRRIRTNTPLQALVTLNDPVYVEAAQALARKTIDSATSTRERINALFQSVLIRPPSEAEIERVTRLVEQSKATYRQSPDDAIKMATDPIGDLPSGADPATYAAWTLAGNVMLNLDELLMKK